MSTTISHPWNMITYSHSSIFHHLSQFDQSPRSMIAACYAVQFVLNQGQVLLYEGHPSEVVGSPDQPHIHCGSSGMHRVPCCKCEHVRGQWYQHCALHSMHGSLSAEC